MRRSSRKGFTLIELVVVLAIIGVLASILVPSVMGYVKKANRSTDLSTAKTIYTDSSALVTDPEVSESYRNNTSTKIQISGSHKKEDYSYDMYIIAYKSANSDSKWISTDGNTNEFIDQLNKMEANKVSLKFRRLSNGGDLETWYLCRRTDDIYSVEVWVGNSSNSNKNPKFRVYPDTDDNYR